MKNLLPPIEYFFGNTPLRNWIANIKPFVIFHWEKHIWSDDRLSSAKGGMLQIPVNENLVKYLDITDNTFKTARDFLYGYDPIDDYWNRCGKRDNEFFKREQEDFHAEVNKAAQYFNSPIMEENPEAMQNLKDRIEQTRRELFDPEFIGPKRHIPKPDFSAYQSGIKDWLYGTEGTEGFKKGELPLIIGHIGHGKSSFGIMEKIAAMERGGHIFYYPELTEDLLLDRLKKYHHQIPDDLLPIEYSEKIQPFSYVTPTEIKVLDLPEPQDETKLNTDNTPWYVKASGGYKNKKNRRK